MLITVRSTIPLLVTYHKALGLKITPDFLFIKSLFDAVRIIINKRGQEISLVYEPLLPIKTDYYLLQWLSYAPLDDFAVRKRELLSSPVLYALQEYLCPLELPLEVLKRVASNIDVYRDVPTQVAQIYQSLARALCGQYTVEIGWKPRKPREVFRVGEHLFYLPVNMPWRARQRLVSLIVRVFTVPVLVKAVLNPVDQNYNYVIQPLDEESKVFAIAKDLTHGLMNPFEWIIFACSRDLKEARQYLLTNLKRRNFTTVPEVAERVKKLAVEEYPNTKIGRVVESIVPTIVKEEAEKKNIELRELDKDFLKDFEKFQSLLVLTI